MDIKNEVMEIIAKNADLEENVVLDPDANIINDLGFNSISLISLIIEMEEHFAVEFDDDMLLMDSMSTPCLLYTSRCV